MNLVTVFVNRSCRHCVNALDRVDDLAARHGVRLAVVDVTAHPEEASRFGVTTSPSVHVQGAGTIHGIPDPLTFAALARPHREAGVT